jgi:hypothetical protein
MKLIATLCAAAAMILVGLGRAQTTSDLVKVHFSTPVTVGVTELPAGDATIQVMENGGGNVTLLVRSAAGPQCNVLVNPITSTEDHAITVKLIRRDDNYSFDQVWITPNNGYEVLR